ncbi:synapsin [Culex quinquefasciatus]|uniref:Synapsin n=1 Tax=Culex quinquefasciatus TaxID=7176 RepID=B0W8H3_CULQU|nr:synapsin [Culex quinquefasciatus]|eukprot:XP_001845007.1 synapsin [Culex quinquefasciatus]
MGNRQMMPCTNPQAGTLSFANFKTSFTSNVNFLKRRFSSGDLSSECEDVDPKDLPPAARPQPPLQQQPMPGGPPNIPPPPAPGTAGSAVSPGPVPGSAPPTGGPELSLSFGKGPQRGTSAPSSPAKSRESLLQRVQSLTGAARDQGASIIGAAVSTAARVQPFNKDKCFTLLVLDDQNTDWSKYFRGKRLHGDYDIRVEQAEFREISLTANADAGPLVSFNRGSSKQPKSFRPDFILVRQAPRDGAKDYRSTLLGLKYGGVPSINSLHSLYQFQDKPWVFAHLLQLQRRLGREAFPLVEQTFFPNPREMKIQFSIATYKS